MMTHTYKHISKESGTCFYVGKTKHPKVRPYQVGKPSRSDKWMQAYEKHCQSKRENLIVVVTEHGDEGSALKQEWDDIQELRPDGNSDYVEHKADNTITLTCTDFNSIMFGGGYSMVSLTNIINIGNHWRGENKMKPYQLAQFMNSAYLKSYIKAASLEWGISEDSFLSVSGRGQLSQTYGHISIAVLLAEKISPAFHARVRHVFIDGQILQNRLHGGEEFKRVNRAIDDFLPSPSGNNKGRHINLALLVRDKCEIVRPDDEELQTWNQEAADSIAQQKRVKILEFISGIIELGVGRDWEHLKELVQKL